MEYSNIIIILSTVVPVLAYLVYIYIRDEYKKEPIPMLLLAAFLGLVAATATFMLDYPEREAFKRPSYLDWWECVDRAFFLYAIPAEVSKFLVLAAFLKVNKFYDEYVDAIVYSVCIALAFVGLKNGWFLHYNVDGQMLRCLLTALVLIPAHFTIGVVMGYYFGLARLHQNKWYYVAALLVPILADGLFCSLFLWIDDQITFDFVAVAALTILGAFMHNITHHESIEHLIDEDIEKGNVTADESNL